MQKLLVVCGPTATGKTALGLQLANRFNGQLISADSRQVYKEMDIGTGKDKPKDHEIWLYDVASPIEDFNIHTYYRLATQAIIDSVSQKTLPIVVGGTGFYIKSLLTPPETMAVPLNEELRSKLYLEPKEALQKKLREVDEAKWNAMNNSDRQNPRRLVRAIEVAGAETLPIKRTYDATIIGLTAPQVFINERIKERIEARLEQGFEDEVKNLLVKYPHWTECQSSHTPGYIQWIKYLRGELSKEAAINEWYFDEVQYAKRQMTWFAKEKNIKWFDITHKNWYDELIIWLKSLTT